MLNPNLEQIQLIPDEYKRYSRHLILPEVGVAGQKRLKAASVLCVGTGGLGSPLLQYLAAAGVGRIGLVDFDVVDCSNLQRQIIHGTSWLGQAKIKSAKHRIHEINPHCQVDLYPVKITAANATEIVQPFDIVVDGTDNFPTRYLLNDTCVLLKKPYVYGSIYRFEGQASVFNYCNGPNYRDLYPEPPPPGLVPSCAEGGVLGVLPGIIGVIQATETIKIILEQGNTLSGRLLVFNALEMKFRELKLTKNPDRAKITRLIDYHQFCGVPDPPPFSEENSTMEEMTVHELHNILRSQDEQYLLVDVRNPNEYEIAKIPGSILVPLSDIETGSGIQTIKQQLGDKTLIAHCKKGGRSAKALEALAAAGVSGINVQGGITAWSQQIDSTVPEY
ncbi:MAG: molybdopterin-synthase adenylyltransferase MoeB [Cyanobacteria bacterium P01_F01_bin.42]